MNSPRTDIYGVIITIFSGFVLLSTFAVAQPLQSHPLSQVDPIDEDLNMSGYNIVDVPLVGGVNV
ncbi:MAG: hypothetical protein ABEJ72_04900, partial [Candidatus Aenigmatarchaeota archaeon]